MSFLNDYSISNTQRSKNLISTRSHKRRCVNRRGANYDENAYHDDLFECHECFETFSYATELLKHAETVHNPSRNTRSSNNSVSDADFYGSLAQKISENLLYHVDGIPKNQTRADATNGQDHKPTIPEASTTNPFVTLNLQDYNFPPGFRLYPDDDDNDNQKGSAFDSEPIDLVNNPTTNTDNDSKEMKPEKEEDKHKTETTINTDNKPTTTNNGLVTDSSNGQSPFKTGSILYICDACGNQFNSLKLFDEHEINNHPNVFCSYTEIDSNHNIPIGIFKNQVYSPNGILKTCKVPVLASSTSEPSIKCTKCRNKFSTASDLYKHILECSSKSKRKTKPPIKAPSPPPSPSSSSSSSSTEPPSMAITPPPTAISTSNNVNNQNNKPKSINSPRQQQPSSSPPPLTPTPAIPSPNPLPSSSSSTSILSNYSSSSSSSSSSFSFSSSSKKAQQPPANVSSTPSTRRSGQQLNRSTPDADSILASLSYNTRSSAKRKLDDTDTDGDCGFSLVKKRNRKVRYVCPHCDQVFTHHLTFAKHIKECEMKEETVNPNSDKSRKAINATATTASSVLASSSSKSTKKQSYNETIRKEEPKERMSKRKGSKGTNWEGHSR